MKPVARKIPQTSGVNRKTSIHSRTTRLTVSLPTTLLNRLRNTVYWIPRLTLAGFVETAIHSRLIHMEAVNGGPFPSRAQELKPGRPRVSRQDLDQSAALEPYVRRLLAAGPIAPMAIQRTQPAVFCSLCDSPMSQGISESPR